MNRFQTAGEAIEYLNRYCGDTKQQAVTRTRKLLEKLGDPQKKLKFVHVGGTNGKGSTCAMTESILRSAGYCTGLFPSPYIEVFNERIQVCGQNIPDDALARLTGVVADAADRMEEHPRHFELITVIGMLYFLERNCDIVVLEVGMGGEFDSTNAIDAPEAAVFTNIGLDHTQYLGSTVEAIAQTKSGIIKPGSAVVLYDNLPSVKKVIEEKAASCGDKVYQAGDVKIRLLSADLSGQRFSALVPSSEGAFKEGEGAGPVSVPASDAASLMKAGRDFCGEKEFFLQLPGPHQLENARTVLMTVKALRDRGWKIPEEAVEKGFSEAVWPARFEVLSKKPVFVLDGGHNPQCAKAIRSAADRYFGAEKVTFLIGMLADKDYMNAVRELLPAGAEFITVTPDSPRALKAEELAEAIRTEGGRAEASKNVTEGIRKALSLKRPVVAFGSLYLAGEIRKQFRNMYSGVCSGRSSV